MFLAAALAVPAPASAKGLAPQRVCGASECVRLDRGARAVIVVDENTHAAAPPPTAHHRLEYAQLGFGPHLFVADGNRLAVEVAGDRGLKWYTLYGAAPERLREAIRRVEPIQAPASWPLRIEGGAAVADDDRWAALPWPIGLATITLALVAVRILKGGSMNKVLTSSLLVIAALMLVSPAAATELESALVCGSDGCSALTDRPSINRLLRTPPKTSTSRTPKTADHYRVEFMFGGPDGPEQHGFSFLYVPAATVFAAGGDTSDELIWFTAPRTPHELVREAVGDLEPFAAPAIWENPNYDPVVIPAEPGPVAARLAEGRHWTTYAVLTAALLLVLLAAAFLARRTRFRKPTTA